VGATRHRGRGTVAAMRVEAYVFITTATPRAVCRAVRRLPGVARADALFGSPDVIALVGGEDIASMDTVIDAIVALPGVAATDSKVARWISDQG
jgi:DNA-binding Lrp family transcriptional regulator